MEDIEDVEEEYFETSDEECGIAVGR